MIFKELLQQVDRNEILEYLCKKDEDSLVIDKISRDRNIDRQAAMQIFFERMKMNYNKVIDKLLNMPPTFEDTLNLMVLSQRDYFGEEECIEVFGVQDNDTECYALEMTPWSEWLGFKVIQKSVDIYGKLVFVAECLYEMTFVSFDEAEIAKQVKELNEISERIKNGKEKTYTAEEVFAELKEKYGFDDSEDEEERETEEERLARMERVKQYNEQKRKEILEN